GLLHGNHHIRQIDTVVAEAEALTQLVGVILGTRHTVERGLEGLGKIDLRSAFGRRCRTRDTGCRRGRTRLCRRRFQLGDHGLNGSGIDSVDFHCFSPTCCAGMRTYPARPDGSNCTSARYPATLSSAYVRKVPISRRNPALFLRLKSSGTPTITLRKKVLSARPPMNIARSIENRRPGAQTWL